MKAFPLDLKKFKKVSSDKTHTILKAPEGHEIKIKHDALHPKMREQLASIPMAEGGKVPAYDSGSLVGDEERTGAASNNRSGMTGNAASGHPSSSTPTGEDVGVTKTKHQKDTEDFSKGASQAIAHPGQNLQDAKYAKGGNIVSKSAEVVKSPVRYADGGEAINPDSNPLPMGSQMTPEQLQALSGTAPAQDPGSLPYGQDVQYATNQPIPIPPPSDNTIKFPEPSAAEAPASDAPPPPPPSAPKRTPATTSAAAPASQPGDAELAKIQSQAPRGSATPPPAPKPGSPEDTSSKLSIAKQMTYDHLMKERQSILQSMIEVKPKTMSSLFADKNLPQKMGMIAGLLLGGMGQGLVGGDNPALSILQNTIDNDLKAQQSNLGKQQSLLANNLALMGNIPDAVKLSKVQMMDYQMHQLVQLAKKYPNNPQIQQNLQALGMMGAQSSSNVMDSLASTLAWRHSVSEIKDPGQKIQFNPIMSPEQKNEAFKQLSQAQSLTSLRDDTLHAFDEIAKLNTPENRITSPYQSKAQIEKLKGITLDKLTKDTSGRVTPETVSLVGSTFKNMLDNKVTTDMGRQQLARILSQNMHFPLLDLAGINMESPPVGEIKSGPPKLGKK